MTIAIHRRGAEHAEERAEMGVFEGEHYVYGDDAFRFFDKWLK